MRVPHFKLRSVLAWITVVAILIGWWRERASSERAVRQLTQQLETAQLQVEQAESRGETQAVLAAPYRPSGEGVLSNARFEGVNLRDAVIQGGASGCQLTVFDFSDLTHASLSGGAASFQEASFKGAILKRAKLGGGVASFELAMFEKADLSEAVLVGNLQGASLKSAKCVGATIKGWLQGANIDGAQFEGADLTGVDAENLGSCYFVTPPTYDAKTKFPDGFRPAEVGWKRSLPSEKD